MPNDTTKNVNKILIVDDNKFIREVLAKILQKAGYRVTSVKNEKI